MRINNIITTNMYLRKNNLSKDNSNTTTALRNNNISFGLVPPVPPVPVDPLTMLVVLAIEGSVIAGIATVSDVKAENKDIKNQIKLYKELFKDSINNTIEKYKNAYNITEQQARKLYENRLKKAIISNNERNLQNKGLNAINGHVKERLQLLNEVIIPINESKNPQCTKPLVPNGIILQGQDTEARNLLANKLKSHLYELGIYSYDIELSNNKNQNTQNILELFKHANNKYKTSKEYTLIHIKNIDSLR